MASRDLAGAKRRRRRRILVGAQGRRLEEVYLNSPTARADLEAEAADADPDALLTPEAIGHMLELVDERRRVVPVPEVPTGRRRRGGVEPLMATGAPLPTAGESVFDALDAEARAVPGIEPMAAPPRMAAAGRARRAPAAPAGAELMTSAAFFSTDTAVIVPGFMGSALSDTAPRGYGLIWVDPKVVVSDQLGLLELGPYDGFERDRDPKVRISALRVLPIVYDVLRLALEVHRYTTEIFPVDWRKDLELAAGSLAARLRILGAQSSRPIHLLAHSQGALVARRAIQILGKAEARRLVRHLVLIGPANYGTFSSVLALAGSHSLVSTMRSLAVVPKRGFQPVMATMTGLYQLMPFDPDRVPWLAAEGRTLGTPAFWGNLADRPRLERFFGWGRTIDTPWFADRTSVILGDYTREGTAAAVAFDSRGVLKPTASLPGDGTVPHSCSVIAGASNYKAAGCEHMKMSNQRLVTDAVRDILADRAVGLPRASDRPADHLG